MDWEYDDCVSENEVCVGQWGYFCDIIIGENMSSNDCYAAQGVIDTSSKTCKQAVYCCSEYGTECVGDYVIVPGTCSDC